MIKSETRTRTENVFLNASVSLGTQFVNLLFSFISRTVFIHILGVEYLGVNGLFTNILTMLSFAEFGFGNAIIYNLYKPLAIKNTEEIKSLMYLYSKIYRWLGVVVAIAGLLVLPFLDYIIKGKPSINENIELIYLLFLLNSVTSYFFVYKKSILQADQKGYIVDVYTQVFHLLQVILQIVLLLITRQFIVYLLLQIFFTIFSNIIIARKSDNLYPYIKSCENSIIDKELKVNIIKNVKALFIYKFASVVLNGTDNIIISAIIGVTAVGLCSNYLLILSVFAAISANIMKAFTSSIGNLNAVGDISVQERVFDKVFFISAWIYGFFSVGLLIFLNKFILLWIGNEYLLDEGVVFALVLHFYVRNLQFASYTYRTTMGLFVQGRIAPVIAAVLNIALSFLLAIKYGLMGIFLATSIARFFAMGIIDPVIIYKFRFHKKPTMYYFKYFKFLTLFVLLYLISDFVVSAIVVESITGFILQLAVYSTFFNGIILALFWRSKDFQEIMNSFLKLYRTKIKKG
jgi:O-antigen/teichoic acid export membrane protein